MYAIPVSGEEKSDRISMLTDVCPLVVVSKANVEFVFRQSIKVSERFRRESRSPTVVPLLRSRIATTNVDLVVFNRKNCLEEAVAAESQTRSVIAVLPLQMFINGFLWRVVGGKRIFVGAPAFHLKVPNKTLLKLTKSPGGSSKLISSRMRAIPSTWNAGIQKRSDSP